MKFKKIKMKSKNSKMNEVFSIFFGSCVAIILGLWSIKMGYENIINYLEGNSYMILNGILGLLGPYHIIIFGLPLLIFGVVGLFLTVDGFFKKN